MTAEQGKHWQHRVQGVLLDADRRDKRRILCPRPRVDLVACILIGTSLGIILTLLLH